MVNISILLVFAKWCGPLKTYEMVEGLVELLVDID